MFASQAIRADARWRIIPRLRRGQRLDRRPAPGRDGPSPPEWFNGLKKAEWVFVIAAYILIQTEAGKAAIVAAALRALPGVSETTSLPGRTMSSPGPRRGTSTSWPSW
jgi:hypothetical protein